MHYKILFKVIVFISPKILRAVFIPPKILRAVSSLCIEGF